ncbi:hypothetical protein ACQ895_01505 [Vibrio parahaemolyticus]|uniref:hypothetical protein n=1 Tax=Vibrio parahaemolyticus TaxID=670 RepID=UPI00387B6726
MKKREKNEVPNYQKATNCKFIISDLISTLEKVGFVKHEEDLQFLANISEVDCLRLMRAGGRALKQGEDVFPHMHEQIAFMLERWRKRQN